jgi:hypothetical protein
MIERVISGGQTGADQAGLRAAHLAGIPTGGFAPLGWETDDGPAPWLANCGLVECSTAGYPTRIMANVSSSGATLWFGVMTTPCAKSTLRACLELGKPHMRVFLGRSLKPSHVAAWIVEHEIHTLNVAGNRESRSPGIGERTEKFLAEVFRQLQTLDDRSPYAGMP